VETPLFICYANCCRSVLAYYLYRHLHADDPALSAGLFAGECINDRALGMLRHWGIDASGHCPRQVDRELCDQASAIFVMAPAHLRRLLRLYGEYLDRKTYLFSTPLSSLDHSIMANTRSTTRPSIPDPPRSWFTHVVGCENVSSRSGWRCGAQATLWLRRPSISR